MSKKQVRLCDGEWCLQYGQMLAKKVCVGCGRDLCGEDHCSARGYFDDYLPYEIKSSLDFCSSCAKKIGLLKKEDIVEYMQYDKTYVSTSSFATALKEHAKELYDESKRALQANLQAMFNSMLQTADKRYGAEQKTQERKKQIQVEIDDLEKKKKELQAKV